MNGLFLWNKEKKYDFVFFRFDIPTKSIIFALRNRFLII